MGLKTETKSRRAGPLRGGTQTHAPHSDPLYLQVVRALKDEIVSGVHPVAPWLDRLLFAPLAIEAAWLGAGRNLPTGQSLLLIGEKML